MFDHISPRSLETPQEIIEYLELHQIAQEFRLEVDYRDQFETYCNWYYQMAEQNRQDYQKMQAELNLLSWFGRAVRPAR